MGWVQKGWGLTRGGYPPFGAEWGDRIPLPPPPPQPLAETLNISVKVGRD